MTAFRVYLLLAIVTTHVIADDIVPPIGHGDLTSLSVEPKEAQLTGTDASMQLIVTGQFSNNGVRDLTRDVKYHSLDAKIATVSSDGFLAPLSNGTTEVIAESAGRSCKLPVTVTGMDQTQPINFANEIVPILTKLGCNNGGCHGKADGQNGFKLSLLGFDPIADYEALVHEARGRRIELAAPRQSLLLAKPTGQLGHGGGKPLGIDSPEHRLLVRWIASGAPFGNDGDPYVTSISVNPGHRITPRQSAQQIRVTAHYSDGSIEDVTRRAEFKSNDPDIIDVTASGLVQTGGHFGEGSVMIRYLGQVGVFRATIPRETKTQNPIEVARNSFVDSFVFAKLNQLGLQPSEVCTDGEFLRRASIDITGTLPTIEEARKFLADKNPKKRERLIDDLLNRSEYVSYFTMKWADILRVRGGVRDTKEKMEASLKAAAKKKITPLDKPAHRADVFRDWIYKSIESNKPYDQFVREIIVTNGDTSGADAKPASLWYLELKTPQGLIEDASQAFLGTRIQCAQCHHHPFEKWSQDDYWGLASFFSRVQWQTGVDKNGKRAKERKPIRLSEAGRMGQFIGFHSEGKLTNPTGKEFVNPKPLDADEFVVPPETDPRETFVDWMVAPDNPFFARAVVNRYWGHFFRHAIVEPLDDMRVTNPPSNGCDPKRCQPLASIAIKKWCR